MKAIQKNLANDGGTGAPRTFRPPGTHANARRTARSTIYKNALAVLGLLLAVEARAVDASLDVGDWAVDSTSRPLPAVLNTAVDVGTFTFAGFTGCLQISVNATGQNWSVAKRYVIPMRYKLLNISAVNTWLKVLPAYDTGPYGKRDFDLDVNADNGVMKVRLRVSGVNGNNPATANIVIESTGVSQLDYPPVITPAAVPPPAATDIFGGSVLTQVAGRVGVNTVPAPDAALDVDGGDTKGFRIRPRSVAGFPASGTWTRGTLIVDSTGALFLCTKNTPPGTPATSWKKVTP